MNQKIVPHLWYDKQAAEAAQLYSATFAEVFPGQVSKIHNVNVLENTPSGSVDAVSFDLCGQEFTSISAGPYFTFTPAISFHVKCDTKEQVDALWEKLSEGGKALMELGSYPFSERYGWAQDKYGLSWQLMYTGSAVVGQRITPVLMFVGDVCGKAEEAVNFYASVFKNARVDEIARYPAGMEPDKEGTVMYAPFTLEDQEFGVMDSAREHAFTFNEAVSLIVNCEDQEEIDYFWEKLSAVPESEQCGWLKDKFGVSWQIVPVGMNEMMSSGDKEKIARVTEAFLKMKKFDIAELERAAEGK